MLAALLVFASILAGCVTALLLVIMMVRFPPLLIAMLLACWPAGLLGLQLTAEYCRKTHWIKKVLPEQPFNGSMQDFFFCQEYPDKQQIIFEFDLSGR